MATAYIKPVGGLKQVAVVPQGITAGDSPQEIQTQVIVLPLFEDSSMYEEIAECADGAMLVHHRLTLTMARDVAQSVVSDAVAQAWSHEGTVAVIVAESGEKFLVGWSERWQHEQPLRLVKSESTTAQSPSEIPIRRLIFESFDDCSAISIT